MEEIDRKRGANVAGIIAQDLLVVVDPAMGHHLLRLLVEDLRRSTGASREWLADLLALTCYVRDALPEELRVPVPTMAEIRGDGGQGLVA